MNGKVRVRYWGFGFSWFKREYRLIGIKSFYDISTDKLVGIRLVFGDPQIPQKKEVTA